MEKIDKAEIRYNLHQKIVQLRDEGKTNDEVAKIVGRCPSRVSTIWNKFKKGGDDALKIAGWGRRKGDQRKLSPGQEREIVDLFMERPKKVFAGLELSLWTKEAIREAIKWKFEIDLSLRATSDYLKRWGVSPQKPAKDSEAFQSWLYTDYPKIIRKAQKEKAEILWCDYKGRTKGECSGVVLPNNIGVISVVRNQGEIRFMAYKEPLTSRVFSSFMSRLNAEIIRDGRRKTYLIVCDHQMHDQDSPEKRQHEPEKKRRATFGNEWHNPNKAQHNRYNRRIELFFRPPDN